MMSQLEPKVLVVEDDALFRQSVTRLLIDRGYQVDATSDVGAALEVIEQHPPDVVLLDLQLPDRSGHALLRVLQRRSTSPPVVVLSGTGTMEDVIEVLRRDVVDYLVKPVPPDQLCRALDKALTEPEAAAEAPEEGDMNVVISRRIDEKAAESGLTPRERETLDLLMLGRNTREIGLAMGIAARTAKYHQANVLRKLDADSRFDLFRLLLL